MLLRRYHDNPEAVQAPDEKPAEKPKPAPVKKAAPAAEKPAEKGDA